MRTRRGLFPASFIALSENGHSIFCRHAATIFMTSGHFGTDKPIGQRIRTITGRLYSQRMENQLMKSGVVLNRNGLLTTRVRSKPCVRAARPSNYSSMNFFSLEDIHSRNHPRWLGPFARTRTADTRVKSVAVVAYRYRLQTHGVWARSHG